MKTGTIINLIFDANRGSVSQLSREGVYGEPFGKLPTPTRRGHTFCGWYCGDVLVTSDSIIETDEDIRLVARWEKAAPVTDKKRSVLKRQKTAIIVLAAVIYQIINEIKEKANLISFSIALIIFAILGFLNPCFSPQVLIVLFVISPNISLLSGSSLSSIWSNLNSTPSRPSPVKLSTLLIIILIFFLKSIEWI